MQLAENEIVRLIDADLARAFIEVAIVQVGDRGRRPGCHFLVEQPRRPAAPVQRATADRVGEPLEWDLRFPRNAPDLVARRLGLRGTLIEEEWASRIGKAEYPGVLDMLR